MNPITAQPIRPLARGTLRVQSDGRLVKLFRRGVDPAFDELVRRYRDSLVRYAGAIAGRDRAEDVVQESLVKAHRSLNGDQLIDPKPWLYKIVRNAALNSIRDSQKHRHDDLGDSASRGHTPHDIAEQRERLAVIVAAVLDLPASQRRALIGHELGGFTHEEIAAELDLSTGATKQLIYRARLTLRNAAGAVIPLPVITWLASDATGIFAAGAATGVVAGSAGSGGILASITGAGTTKLAMIAVVAGGSLTAGMATEKKQSPESVSAQAAGPSSTNALIGGGPDGLPPVAPAFATDGRRTSDAFGKGSRKESDDDESRGDEQDDDGPERSGMPGKNRPSESRYDSDSDDDDDHERDRPESDLEGPDDDGPQIAGTDDDDDDDPSQLSPDDDDSSGSGSVDDSDDEVIALPPTLPKLEPGKKPGPVPEDL